MPIPNLSLAQTAQSSAGDVTAGFVNNAGLVVGGSGKVAADTGQTTPGDGATSYTPVLILGGVAVLGITLWLILRK